ncbi:hypothetical protein [Lichenifustis flavocetrariae]|uniref:Uncharacterized protein n=1 Tax=Lichenifustis flavocetrariae TaxID=2949735 RepID=A0AA41YZ53_9HYPH|nr:hypothetical protein [Lichenifustis flavocetrariae]MCW6507495.1 hypothetical protein [Lichenifustis flavocetrariae]
MQRFVTHHKVGEILRSAGCGNMRDAHGLRVGLGGGCLADSFSLGCLSGAAAEGVAMWNER